MINIPNYHQLSLSSLLCAATTNSLPSTPHPYHQLPPAPYHQLTIPTINSHPPVCNYQTTPYHQLTISIPSTPTLLCATTRQLPTINSPSLYHQLPPSCVQLPPNLSPSCVQAPARSSFAAVLLLDGPSQHLQRCVAYKGM